MFWELAERRLIPAWMFVIGCVALAFLLGLSSGPALKVAREGLSLAVLVIFVGVLQQAGLAGGYLGFAAVLAGVLVFGRIARLSAWAVFAAVGLVAGGYLAYRLGVVAP